MQTHTQTKNTYTIVRSGVKASYTLNEVEQVRHSDINITNKLAETIKIQDLYWRWWEI